MSVGPFFSRSKRTARVCGNVEIGIYYFHQPQHNRKPRGGVRKKYKRSFPLDKESFFVKAEKKEDPYEELARRVAEESAFAGARP